MGQENAYAGDTSENVAVPKKKEIYFLRTLCAIILFFITYTHYYVPYEYNEIIFGVGRFAIPIFFLLSGYYAYSKDGHAEKRIGKKTLHILYLLIFLKLLYLALDVIYYSAGVIDIDYLIQSFVTWTGTTSHAWFLYSLVLVYLFWWILIRKNIDTTKTYPLIYIILFLDLLFCEFMPMAGIDYIGNVTTVKIGETIYPFICLPFFAIGNYMHRNKEKIDANISTNTLGMLVVIGVVLSFAEAFVVRTANLYVGSIILGLSLFLICFRIPDGRLRFKTLEFMGRSLTPWLYVFYPGVIFFLKEILLSSYKDVEWLYYGLGPFIAIALNILLAYLMHRLLKIVKSSAKKKNAAKISAA